MTVMRAKYAGRDSGTGARFQAGTVIDYDRWRKTAAVLEPGMPAYDAFIESEAGAGDSSYLAHRTRTNPAYVSNVFGIGGREYYRNKAGRCEDAPACGCCTI